MAEQTLTHLLLGLHLYHHHSPCTRRYMYCLQTKHASARKYFSLAHVGGSTYVLDGVQLSWDGEKASSPFFRQPMFMLHSTQALLSFLDCPKDTLWKTTRSTSPAACLSESAVVQPDWSHAINNFRHAFGLSLKFSLTDQRDKIVTGAHVRTHAMDTCATVLAWPVSGISRSNRWKGEMGWVRRGGDLPSYARLGRQQTLRWGDLRQRCCADSESINHFTILSNKLHPNQSWQMKDPRQQARHLQQIATHMVLQEESRGEHFVARVV